MKAEAILDCRTFRTERGECASIIDSPGELHGRYLCAALVCLMANHYVALHSCDNRCQPCALPSVKKTMNTTCRGLYVPFFLCSKGSGAAGTSAHTKSGYHRVPPAPRPSLSERRSQVSGLYTWKRRIMSKHNKVSVLSTQLRSLVPIGCSRQSTGEVLSVADISNFRLLSVSFPGKCAKL